MRIAYFSPLPPKRTGIATYSKHLLPALAAKAEVEVFDHGEIENVGFQVHDYESQPSLLAMADDCDACIYHIGNNPFFHSRMLWDVPLCYSTPPPPLKKNQYLGTSGQTLHTCQSSPHLTSKHRQSHYSITTQFNIIPIR